MSRRLGTRWVVGVFVVLAVVVLFVNLGLWQLRRLDQRRAFEDEVRQGLAAEPIDLDAFPVDEIDGSMAYRRARVTGHYLEESGFVLLGRALEGQPGNHVLAKLAASSGGLLVVDRGWIPYDADGRVPGSAEAPDTEVVLTGVLLPGEGDAKVRPGPDGLTVTAVDLDALGAPAGQNVARLYLSLDSQTPPQTALPRLAPFRLSEAPPHLSYAIQWFTFAAIAVIGYAFLLRREGRRPRVDTPAGFGDDAPDPVRTRTEE